MRPYGGPARRGLRRCGLEFRLSVQLTIREQVAQFVKVCRLHEMKVEPESASHLAVLVSSIASHRHEIQVSMRISQPASKLIPVHAGESDIHQCALRLEIFGYG
jgi:hypothetical protein